MKTACSMITLIYTSRCQQNTLPIPYMHYNVTYFTVDNFWDDKCFTEESLRDDWIDNIQRKYSIVPRNLLFQENPQYGVGGVDHDNDNEGSTAILDKNFHILLLQISKVTSIFDSNLYIVSFVQC